PFEGLYCIAVLFLSEKISFSLPVYCGCCGIKKVGTYWSICPKFLPLHHSAREGKGRWVSGTYAPVADGTEKRKKHFCFSGKLSYLCSPSGKGGKKIRYGRPLAASGYKCRSAKRRRY